MILQILGVIVLVSIVCCVIWIAFEANRAPEGWEDDETGFNYGRRTK